MKHLAAALLLILSTFAFLSGQYHPPASGTASFVTLTGSLTIAQILALQSAPPQVIGAQGSGTVILVDQFTAELLAGGTPYTSALNTFAPRYNNAAGVALTSGCSGQVAFLNASTNAFCAPSLAFTAGAALTAYVNLPVVLSVNTANPLAGNGTINYWIRYHVLTGF
jgi:hypothetical protein